AGFDLGPRLGPALTRRGWSVLVLLRSLRAAAGEGERGCRPGPPAQSRPSRRAPGPRGLLLPWALGIRSGARGARSCARAPAEQRKRVLQPRGHSPPAGQVVGG